VFPVTIGGPKVRASAMVIDVTAPVPPAAADLEVSAKFARTAIAERAAPHAGRPAGASTAPITGGRAGHGERLDARRDGARWRAPAV